MADSKLDALTEITAPVGTDLVYVEHDPAGTPVDRKAKLANLLAAIGAQQAGTYLAPANIDDTAYNAGTWDADTTHAPSKNAVRDEVEVLVTALAGKAPLRVVIPADKTADYTLVVTDSGSSIGVNSATAKNVTIASGVHAVGDMGEVRQVGAGQVTIVASGTTLRAKNGLKTSGQYAALAWLCVATDVFSITGDTTT